MPDYRQQEWVEHTYIPDATQNLQRLAEQQAFQEALDRYAEMQKKTITVLPPDAGKLLPPKDELDGIYW